MLGEVHITLFVHQLFQRQCLRLLHRLIAILLGLVPEALGCSLPIVELVDVVIRICGDTLIGRHGRILQFWRRVVRILQLIIADNLLLILLVHVCRREIRVVRQVHYQLVAAHLFNRFWILLIQKSLHPPHIIGIIKQLILFLLKFANRCIFAQ